MEQILIIAAGAVFGAYFRRIKGGGWWAKNQGPWWAAEGLLYLWMILFLTPALWGLGVAWWACPGMAVLQALLWNIGHSCLSMGRQPGEPERAAKKPIARIVMPLANLVATPDSRLWCGVVLSLDYGVRTAIVGGMGAWVIGPAFAWYMLGGLLAGVAYDMGWRWWDAGDRSIPMQPEDPGGHLFGEFINGAWLTMLFLAAAAQARV